jgi:hypothetical protein
MVVSYFWRYSCLGSGGKCYAGGFVSSALAFSYNSRNWTGFGQKIPTHTASAAILQPAVASLKDHRKSVKVAAESASTITIMATETAASATATITAEVLAGPNPVVPRGPTNGTDLGGGGPCPRFAAHPFTHFGRGFWAAPPLLPPAPLPCSLEYSFTSPF